MRYFTIGMAGHIDHGKTSLTKALTGVYTDRLKEEQERNISIELGFAPFIDEDDLEVSIIDVPGHENFIRQMIAGVAGIDFVIVAIAADEGIMPQTKEHVDILSLLGIEQGAIVITKMDLADEELLEIILDDISDTLVGTFLQDAPMFFVDSLSERGIPELKQALTEKLQKMTKKKSNTPFRLPIDHVFTVKGQGVIVRGTVYDGTVKQGDTVTVLPSRENVRIRQIQRHNNEVAMASQGQRAAMNLGGIAYKNINRGDVLVKSDFFAVSDRIDIVFQPLDSIKRLIKQRQLIKLHIGTTEVMGKIIFFDRNEMHTNETNEILCQLELTEKVVVTQGDKCIVRRPSPVETIGGGTIIDPHATKHRFGKATIEALQTKQAGTAEERIDSFLKEASVASKTDILKYAAISTTDFTEIKQHLRQVNTNLYTTIFVYDQVTHELETRLENFHKEWPMRVGMNKAEITSSVAEHYPTSLVEHTLSSLHDENIITIEEQYVAHSHFTPHMPSTWEKKLSSIEKTLVHQGVEVEQWEDLMAGQKVNNEIQREFYYFLIHQKRAYVFDDERLISAQATTNALKLLEDETNRGNFNLQTARDILGLSRKNLVPLLELFDNLKYTRREGNERTWL